MEVAFERAVTIPLNAYVKPNVVKDLKGMFSIFGNVPTDITFIDSREFPIADTRHRTLLSKVIRAPSVIKQIAAGITIAESKEEIEGLIDGPDDWNIAVSKDGTVVAPGWISICDRKNEKTNLILRENEIRRLKNRLTNLEKQILDIQNMLNGHNNKLEQLHLEEQIIEDKIQERELRVVGAKESYLELKAKAGQRATRLESIKSAKEEAQSVWLKESEKEEELKQNLSSAEKQIESIFIEKQETAIKNKSIQTQTEDSRLELQKKTEHLHSLEIQLQNLKAKEETLNSQFYKTKNKKKILKTGKTEYVHHCKMTKFQKKMNLKI